ncbi:MAG: serine/threonine protein kinase [Deltaproteobacteria bacterium]|nr:serine/threonine protein kinase [Deltaproteobacteria bacterium]
MNNDTNDVIEPGTILNGKYRVEELVGAGGMGAVYRATHTVIGRTVAIKTLHTPFVKNESVLQRFQREAQLAGSIGHDNICEVTDFGTTEGGSPYLVMPLLKGASLSDVLDRETELSTDRLFDIMSQTLSALEAAHKSQIVHRDLKPDNIFVTRVGDRDNFVKLLDFGISKVLDQDTVLNLTRTGTVIGTPFYMSPEQAKGAKDVDHRADIYAIGVILYEALTGKRPFEGDSYNEVMFKIIAEPYPNPSDINSAIPPAIEKIVLTAMARDPAERYETADKMRTAIGEVVSGYRPAPTATSAATVTSATKSRSAGPRTGPDATATPLATESATITQVAIRAPKRPFMAALLGAVVAIIVAASIIAGLVFLRDEPEDANIIVPLTSPAPPQAPVPPVGSPIVEPPQAKLADIKETPTDEETPTAEETKQDTQPGEEKKSKSKRRKKDRAKRDKKKDSKVVITANPSEVKLPDEDAKKKDKGVVKGRFGTNVVSDYDE